MYILYIIYIEVYLLGFYNIRLRIKIFILQIYIYISQNAKYVNIGIRAYRKTGLCYRKMYPYKMVKYTHKMVKRTLFS